MIPPGPSPLPPATAGASAADKLAFETYIRTVRDVLEPALSVALDHRREVAKSRAGQDAVVLVDEIAALTLRGGKRVRGVLLAAAFEACGGVGGPRAIAPALVAFELLHTYLLIHDDWMDGDDLRRGGPSVHASLGARYGSRREGDVSAILAGDLAAAFALEELARCPVAPAILTAAIKRFAEVQSTVVLGQQLDVRANAEDEEAVERMHDLKTASYTSSGPIALGAILAGASPERLDALARFSRPLGVAFQLRDDVLGTFGDTSVTGKSAATDLHEAKRTALAVNLPARGSAEGAKARVEERMRTLVAEARTALANVGLAPEFESLFRGAVEMLVERVA